MLIRVNGKQIDVGQSLTNHVEAQLSDIVHKYAEKPVEAAVTFSKDRYEFVADISVHLSTGLTSKSHAKSGEIYGAFDASLDKMETQLRRYKRRLKDHHKERTKPVEFVDAPAYIIDAGKNIEQEEEPDSLQPVIVAEMATQVKSLSVGEAVMQMELDGAPVIVFRNNSHGGVNVVYQREDGNIGWIDPKTIDA